MILIINRYVDFVYGSIVYLAIMTYITTILQDLDPLHLPLCRFCLRFDSLSGNNDPQKSPTFVNEIFQKEHTPRVDLRLC